MAANKAETEAVLGDIRSDGPARVRLSRAIAGWYRYTIEAPGVPTFLAEAWAAASRRPPIRDIVALRRERIVMVATVVLQEAVADGELAADLDVDATSRALGALLDGVVLECIWSAAAVAGGCRAAGAAAARTECRIRPQTPNRGRDSSCLTAVPGLHHQALFTKASRVLGVVRVRLTSVSGGLPET